jgi:GAF domain-containing protein
MLGTLEDEIANGAYFPPEIIEKGTGFFSQSWLGVPIMAGGQVLGLVALADARAHAFNENHLRLLQTLSSNVGAALENARLFAETQRLLKETTARSELASLTAYRKGWHQTGSASHLRIDRRRSARSVQRPGRRHCDL